MIDYVYWGAIAILAVFIVLQIYDMIVMRSRSGIDLFLDRDQKREGFTQRVGQTLLGQFSFLEDWKTHLEWAHLGEKLENVSMAEVVFISLALGILGFVISLFSPIPAVRLLPFAAVMPLLHVKTVGEGVKKAAERTLPELSALIAAELSVGASVEDAIARAAQMPGPLSRILDMAVDRATTAGRPLTSRGTTQVGMLREVLTEMKLPALRGFAVQLDSVAKVGVEGAERMQEISRALAAEYRQRMRDNLSTLDKKLTIAVAAFYFAPFFLILLVGTFSAAIGSF